MNEKYFVKYEDDNELCLDVCDIEEIANLYKTGKQNIAVFRYIGGDVQRLELHVEHKSKLVWLEDRYGNYIEGSK